MAIAALQDVKSQLVDITAANAAQPGVLLASGGVPLTGNWNAGNFTIQSQNSVGVFNVKAYGALGNSTNGTDGQDDTTFIQAAITAASAAGGTVEFPVGFYRITSTLTITAQFGVILKGEAGSYASPGAFRGSTIVWNGAASGKMLSVTSTAGTQSGDITVTGLGFDAGGAGIGGVTCIYADANTQVNKGLTVFLCHFRRFNRGIQIGDYTNNGNNDYQIDKVSILRCRFFEGSDTVSSAAVVYDSRNASTCDILECEFFSLRYGIWYKRVGFAKVQTCAAGAPNDVMDGIYVDGLHATLEFNQFECEVANSSITITANAIGGLFNPIYMTGCTFNSNNAGTKPAISVNAAHKITSVGNTYNRPINFAAGASQFMTWGDLFDSTNFNAAVTVNATNTVVIGTAGTSSLTPATDSQAGLRTTMALFTPPCSFSVVGSGAPTNGTNAYVDVTNMTTTFTPPTNCRATVIATFDTQNTGAAADTFIYTINVNGTDQTITANLNPPAAGNVRFTTSQTYTLDLTGGTSYTIKGRFKCATGGLTTITTYGANSTLNIILLGRYV